ncbi:MAG: UDP-N-acetylmuramyl peptide synthase, partial [Sphaerochaeta sp.]|nr:UDP-N-acetylmuramyl peptide synthase [Sphaerochaeta sp.]
RGEDDANICKDIRSQMENTNCIIEEIGDRTAAIQRAIELSKPGDTLLFLSKGHETTIEGSGGKRPWNEEETVRTMLKNKKVEAL